MTQPNVTRRRAALGYLASLGAAAAYGAAAVVGRKIVGEIASPMVTTAFSMVIGTLIVGAMFYRHVGADSAHAPRRAWLFTALAGCASAWGVASFFFALSKAPVVLVAPVTGVSPLFAIVLTHLFLGRLERVTWRTAVGAALVVAGVTLIALGAR